MKVNLSEKLIWLRRSKFLKLLDEETLRELAVASPDRHYRGGETVFAAGDEAKALYFVKQGSVLLVRSSLDGKEKVVGLAGPGDLVGELLLAPGLGRRRSHALAWEDTTVCALGRELLLGLMARRPQMALELVRLLASRLLQSHDEIETLSFDSTEFRVARTLLRLANELGESFPITHEQVGRLVGASRETVTGVLGKLRKTGAVQFRYGQVTVDRHRLQERVGDTSLALSV